MRSLIYEIEKGVSFPEPYNLAVLWGAAPKFVPLSIPGFDRIAVVRDPIRRFISAYRNRVLYYNEISRERMRNRGVSESLPERPGIMDFISNLNEYRKIWPIAQHTHPQTFFLGDDPRFFQRIFHLESLHELEGYISERLSRPVSLPRFRTEGPPADEIKIPPSAIDYLKKVYEADYRFLETIKTAPPTDGAIR